MAKSSPYPGSLNDFGGGVESNDTGGGGGSLLIVNNLSDLDDTATARTNLGVGDVVDGGAPDSIYIGSTQIDGGTP